jgi:sec-independent protein translocase protein TatA
MPATVPTTLAFLGLPGGMEWVVILVIGLLLFGSRLPTVGRSIGKSITEFKKGLKDATDDVNDTGDHQGSGQGANAPRQLTQEQLMENATQEALRRMKAEQANQAGGAARNP